VSGRGAVIAFLGPSLPASEARALGAKVLGPARQGDVWRALEQRPRAIALVDGIFESQPSVWHHELLDALDAGVLVFGGASMGALRAAELGFQGMIGVGQIFRWYRDGVCTDDADVAMLHADAEHGYRPLTLPQVNVRHAAALAVAARVLTRPAARALVEASARIFYQARSWPAVLSSAPLAARQRERLRAWLPAGAVDLKAADARETIAAAAQAASGRAPVPRQPAPSSAVRQRKLDAAALRALRKRPDADELIDAGLRRALLAGWARSLGLRPDAAEIAAVAAFDERGFTAAEALRLREELALERLVLEHAARMLPDGPSRDEALAAEARLRGLWSKVRRQEDPP
jgi:hypothetical protein